MLLRPWSQPTLPPSLPPSLLSYHASSRPSTPLSTSLPPSLPPSFPTMHLAVLPLPRVLVPVGNEEGALAADYAVHPLPAFLDWLEGREGGKECELLASFIHLSLVQARRSDRLILHFHPSFLAPSLPSSLHSSTPVFVSVGKA